MQLLKNDGDLFELIDSDIQLVLGPKDDSPPTEKKKLKA